MLFYQRAAPLERVVFRFLLCYQTRRTCLQTEPRTCLSYLSFFSMAYALSAEALAKAGSMPSDFFLFTFYLPVFFVHKKHRCRIAPAPGFHYPLTQISPMNPTEKKKMARCGRSSNLLQYTKKLN